MAAVQLIERVELSASLWLTFWNLETERQVSIEIARPTYVYNVGQLYQYYTKEKDERAALRPIADRGEVRQFRLLIPATPHPSSNLTDGATGGDQGSGSSAARNLQSGTTASAFATLRRGMLRSVS